MNAHEDLILIVDDQPENLQMLSTTLREAGYSVAAATSGPTALRILDRRQPALVLCDVVMPEMDGYEVCRRLKALPETRDIPLMFLTARTDNQAILSGFESGAADYVTKPFNTGELLARVRTQLELRQARRQLLAHADRLEALSRHQDQLLRKAAGEIRVPLEAMLGALIELERCSLELSHQELSSRLQGLQAEMRRLLATLEPMLAAGPESAGMT